MPTMPTTVQGALDGFWLRDARLAEGLTQEALAVNCGMSRTSIVNIETGRQRITGDGLPVICQALGYKVSLQWKRA